MGAGRIVSVGHVGLRTADVARSVAFYRDVLGLEHVVASPGFNAFAVGDVHLCIMPGKPRKTADFDLATDDVEALHARLKAAGVMCTKPQDDRFSGHRSFKIVDPDGHGIQVLSAHA